MPEDQKPPEEDKGKVQAPAGTETGQAAGKTGEAPSQLPEKFRGKTPDEIAKAYVELERKLGESSTEVEEARKLKEQFDPLLRAIWSDPDLYRQVEAGIQKVITGETLPESRKPAVKQPQKGDEEDKERIRSEMADLRRSEENRVLNEFYTKFGYNSLPANERQEKNKVLAVALAELLDPGGKKPLKQVLSDVPLDKLPKFLENAHFLANKDSLFEQGRRSALLSEEENRAASIGSFAASSGKSAPDVRLTQSEREIAQKMGVSEDAYLKRKRQIAEEAKKFE